MEETCHQRPETVHKAFQQNLRVKMITDTPFLITIAGELGKNKINFVIASYL